MQFRELYVHPAGILDQITKSEAVRETKQVGLPGASRVHWDKPSGVNGLLLFMYAAEGQCVFAYPTDQIIFFHLMETMA